MPNFSGLLLAAMPSSFRHKPSAAVPKALQGWVIASLNSEFWQEDTTGLLDRGDDLDISLTERFPKVAELMPEAKIVVLAFGFPEAPLEKMWSINPLERLNEEVKRRNRVVGIFPNSASIPHLVGAVLL